MASPEVSTVRLVLQQCTRATLKHPKNDDRDEEMREIGAGMVVYVCFTKGATEDSALKAADLASRLRLCEPEEDKGSRETTSKRRTSILDTKGDLLIVPQATLGGKLKGKAVQYHGNLDRNEGERLYNLFVDSLRSLVCNSTSPNSSETSPNSLGTSRNSRDTSSNSLGTEQKSPETSQTSLETSLNSSKTSPASPKVLCGVYGSRQILSMETNGPYTHSFQL